MSSETLDTRIKGDIKGTPEKKTVTSPSKNTAEKEKEKNIGNYKALCTKAQTQK